MSKPHGKKRARRGCISAIALFACLAPLLGPIPPTAAKETSQAVVAAPDQVLFFRVNGTVIAAAWGDGRLSLVDFEDQQHFPDVDTGTGHPPLLPDEATVSDSLPPWVAFRTPRAAKPLSYQLLQLTRGSTAPWDPPPEMDDGRCIAIAGGASIWKCGVLGLQSVDLATKRLKWRVGTHDVQTAQALKFAQDCKCIAICLPEEVRCRDQAGKLLWSVPLADHRQAINGDNCRMVPQPAFGTAVTVYNATAREITTIELSSGKQEWHCPVRNFHDVAAASANGSMAVIDDETGARLIQLRTGVALPIKIARTSEFYFADGDRALVALPGVSKWEQRADGTIGVVRERNTCEVIDPETGVVRSEFAFTKQVTGDLSH